MSAPWRLIQLTDGRTWRACLGCDSVYPPEGIHEVCYTSPFAGILDLMNFGETLRYQSPDVPGYPVYGGQGCIA